MGQRNNHLKEDSILDLENKIVLTRRNWQKTHLLKIRNRANNKDIWNNKTIQIDDRLELEPNGVIFAKFNSTL